MNPEKTILVNSNGINLLIEKEQEKIELLNTKIDEYKKLADDVNWRGPTKETVLYRFYENVLDMENISKRLQVFIKFLDIVVNNYGEGLEEIKKEMKKIEDEEMLRRLNDGI
ncbi:MAG: hypothetical protein J6X02_05615 [Bacilli bacterium]|nr:hypothetical protein [Bacilli bacterium]